MRLHRFYIGEIIGDKKEITINSSEQVNQIRRVFRLKTGDSIICFDGSGSDYECRIEDFGKDSILLAISSTSKSRYMPEREIFLCAAVVKKDTFEWIVEKATELGVTNIIPVMAERSEKKSLNEERLRKISIEASEQSGRGNVPNISEVISLDQAVSMLKNMEGVKVVAFHTEAYNGQEKSGSNNNFGGKSPVAVLVGPEGGWSQNEISMFHENGVELKCLGRQVLRAETASISALSLVVFGK